MPGSSTVIVSSSGRGRASRRLLVTALSNRTDLTDTEIVHILTLGVATYAEPRFGSRFRHNAYFIGPNVRGAIAEGRADYTPIFLSEIAALFRTGRVVIDVACISVSPPDEHGYCSYGVSTDIVKPAAECARVVVAEVNAQMPRALGDCFIHVRDIDVLVPSDTPVLEASHGEPDALSAAIAKHIANLIEDGATLAARHRHHPRRRPALPRRLQGPRHPHRDVQRRADPAGREGRRHQRGKTFHRGKIVASFVMGSRKLYDFIDNNPLVEFHPTDYVNDPFNIARNDKMISINAAIEVDLTGQVCADSLGTMFYSGIGGQVDFTRGAARSKGGKPIIALPSTAEHETISRIVPYLKQGAGVVTSRGDVHYVVTEYGAAYLHGKSIRERAMALIEIAHPKFRPWLFGEAKSRKMVYTDQIEFPFKTVAYPSELERWVTLKDGTKIFIRPLRLTDEPLVRELFYRLSPESVHYRFFQMLKSMPHEKLQELLRVDYESDMAMIGLTDSDEAGHAVAIAHYMKDPKTNFAESAFLVRDDWQGKGIGTLLMTALVEAAQLAGIAGFTGEVLMENHGMLRVFHKCGFAVESALRDGVYSLRIPFAPKRHQPPSQPA